MSHLLNSTNNTTMINPSYKPPHTQRSQINHSNHRQFNEYEIDYTDYVSQIEIYKWRHKIHHPILKIIAVKQNPQMKRVSLTCQNMVYKFNDITAMKIQQIIYSMSQMLLGYQSILMRLGFVCVQENMIGLNDKGEILLWVNNNPFKNTPGSTKLIKQQDILIKTTSILQQKCSIHNLTFFDQLRQIPLTFTSYLDFLMGFKMKHKLKIVPKIIVNKMNKVTEIQNKVNKEYAKQQRNQQHKINKTIINRNNICNDGLNRFLSQSNQHNHPIQRYRQSMPPLITSTSANYIPTVKEVNKQSGSFNEIKMVMSNNMNSQSESQFIGINRLHSDHQLIPLNNNLHLQSCKSSKKTSIIYPNNNNQIIINDQNQNNNLEYHQIYNNLNNQTMENNHFTETNQQSIKSSSSKINFCYSQKRNDFLTTPRQSTFLRDYTSDRRLPTLTKIQSSTNQIREFTLMDDKRQLNQKMSKSTNNIQNNINRKASLSYRKIVPSYTITYNPITDTLILQNQLQLKKSTLSSLSQKTFKSQQQNYDSVIPSSKSQNKTSMTTNHRSATSQSHQSLGKCSGLGNNNNVISMTNSNNEDGLDGLGKRNNNMFSSNSSHRVCYSVVRDSLVENEGVKNTKSILINTSQQLMNNSQHFSNTNIRQQPFMNTNQQLMFNPNTKGALTTSLFARQPTRTTSIMNNSQQRLQQNNPNMYTFGGLIVPMGQDKEHEQHKNTIEQSKTLYNNKQQPQYQQEPTLLIPTSRTITNLFPTIVTSSTIISNDQYSKQQQQKDNGNQLQKNKQTKIKLSTTSVKSIQQLYKNINSKSQKKSIILNGNNDTLNNGYSIEQQEYKIHLSPMAKHQPPITPIKQSFAINYDANNQHNNNKFKKNHLQYLLSPVTTHNNIKQSQLLPKPLQTKQQSQQFDYNQWRGITGLLNQSNIHELKQSIHCGPEIRAPLNIKLQLLDKFGRQIGHSILPSTPNGFMSSTPNNGFANSCARSICIDEQ